MRLSGETEATQGLGPHDHVCWAYEDLGEVRCRTLEFLGDGLALGQRVRYLAAGDIDTLLADLQELAGFERALRHGALQVHSLDAMAWGDRPVEQAAQVRAYAAATEDALAAGFTGLRVAAEATPLVRSIDQLDAFAYYENLVDRYMTRRPFAAMCAYNVTELGTEAVTQLACMHPVTNPGATPFRLHASSTATASLAGELDMTSLQLFPLALRRADLRPSNGELTIDATDLVFIDHRSLITLGHYARDRGATAVLRTANTCAARVVEVLDLPDVRVELPV